MVSNLHSRVVLGLALLCCGKVAFAQAVPRPNGAGAGGFRSAYPQHPPADPAVLEKGKGVYSVNCSFCHGSDARGGDGGGPNLLRSNVVLNDQSGEQILPIVRNGRPERGMPGFANLTEPQITAIAVYLHSFPVGGRDVARNKPKTIVVGSAAAGKTYFETKCASCHSVTGDIKNFVSHTQDDIAIQQTWLMANGGRGANAIKVPPTTVTIDLPDGTKVEGVLERIDDFLVTLRDSNGDLRSFPIANGKPAAHIHDPLQPHLDMLSTYSDKTIHDITAYLVSLR